MLKANSSSGSAGHMFRDIFEWCIEVGNTPLWGTPRPRLLKKKRAVGSNIEGSRFVNFVLEGELQRGSQTKFAVDGTDIEVTDGTWIFGEMRLGSKVKVSGSTCYQGVHLVTKVVVHGG